jgi:SAM-dependent methyltransferase
MKTSGAIVALLLALWTPAPAQTPQAAPATDAQVYEAFRTWATSQQPPISDYNAALERYKQVLAGQGLSPAEVDRRFQIIVTQGQRLEVERWNRILTSSSAPFNRQPNEFLARMAQGRTPGKALDVGMGQGRNAIFLAQQGWTVTGFDPADKAVAAAQAEAKRLGVRLTAVIDDDEHFPFGREQWDLIVLSYVGVRGLPERLYDALKPGGIVVIEAFHRDATKDGPIGGAVVFDTNELLKLFERFRILQYEDAEAVGDFGLRKTRVVRLAAQKP